MPKYKLTVLNCAYDVLDPQRAQPVPSRVWPGRASYGIAQGFSPTIKENGLHVFIMKSSVPTLSFSTLMLKISWMKIMCLLHSESPTNFKRLFPARSIFGHMVKMSEANKEFLGKEFSRLGAVEILKDAKLDDYVRKFKTKNLNKAFLRNWMKHKLIDRRMPAVGLDRKQMQNGRFDRQPLKTIAPEALFPGDSNRIEWLTELRAAMKREQHLINPAYRPGEKFLNTPEDISKVSHFILSQRNASPNVKRFRTTYVAPLLERLRPFVETFLAEHGRKPPIKLKNVAVFANIYEVGEFHGASHHTDHVNICTVVVNLTGDNGEDALYFDVTGKRRRFARAIMLPGEAFIMEKDTDHGVSTVPRVHERITLNVFYGYIRR